MSLKPYPHYKDSGVKWLEWVPEQWCILPGKRHLTVRKEIVGDRHEQFSRLSLTLNGVLPRSKNSNEGLSPDSFSTYQVLRHGELVFKMIDLENRSTSRVGLSHAEGLVSSAYIVATTDSELREKYAYWFYTSLYVQGIYNVLGSGVRSTLNADDVLNIDILLPSASEQHAIANFLDRETAEIDAFITDQEKLIALLAERRTATITHAVTKGLNPDAQMTESGNDWVGVLPAHWTLPAMKYLSTLQTGVTLGKEFGPEAYEFLYLRVANVQVGYVDLSDVKTVCVTPEVAERSKLRYGDVLMTEGGDRDKLGRGCIWRAPIQNCLHQNHIFAVRCGNDLSNDFLVYVLDSQVARNYFYATAKQTTNLAATNSTVVKNFRFALPPRKEQQEIVEYLDHECREIDAAVADAQEAIALSKERRAALISAAVTGKIDVRGPGAPASMGEAVSVGVA